MEPDEGLTLETSAFQLFHLGNSTFIHSFDKSKLPRIAQQTLFNRDRSELRKSNKILSQSYEDGRSLDYIFSAVYT